MNFEENEQKSKEKNQIKNLFYETLIDEKEKFL